MVLPSPESRGLANIHVLGVLKAVYLLIHATHLLVVDKQGCAEIFGIELLNDQPLLENVPSRFRRQVHIVYKTDVLGQVAASGSNTKPSRWPT